MASSLAKTVVKPFPKKALESGISHAGEKLGKKAAVKSGDLIMKKLDSRFSKSKPQETKITRPQEVPRQNESTDGILNCLISGSGKKKTKNYLS